MSNGTPDPLKKYGHLVVVSFCLALLASAVVAGAFSHWFNQRLLSDFWPVDKSTIAPNILASVIIFDVVTLTAALFYPPFKRLLDRSVQLHKDEIKQHLSSELEAVHAKMDHVILHSKDIPAFVSPADRPKRGPKGQFAKKP